MKKVISFILVLTIVFSLFAGLGVNANAESYPFLSTVINDNISVPIGEDCMLVYRYIPSFTNETLIFRVYSLDTEKIVYQESRKLSNRSYSYNSTVVFYPEIMVFRFETTGLSWGSYRVEVTKNFYTNYAWHTAPEVTTNYVFLYVDDNCGAADKNAYKGTAESFLNLSNETVTPKSTSVCYASSAWNRNYIDRNHINYEKFYIQLKEMYLGKTADTMIVNESVNTDSLGLPVDAQWVFMKYHIENVGNKVLDAYYVLNPSDCLFKYTGVSMTVYDVAIVSKEKTTVTNTKINPGEEADVWLGVLIPTSQGLPYVGIADWDSDDYVFLNTNPGLLNGSKKTGHCYQMNDIKCPVCGARNPNYNTVFSTKVALKAAARTANAMKVQWNKVKTVTGYQVQISNAAGTAWGKAYTTTGNTYLFKNLAAGSNYKFRVRFYITKNGKNYFSPWSKTLGSPTLPAGTTVKATAGAKAFTAAWGRKAVTGYQLQYATNAKFTGAKTVTIKNAKAYKYVVKNLKAKTNYYVRIRTYKTIARVNYFSTWSTAVKVKTK